MDEVLVESTDPLFGIQMGKRTLRVHGKGKCAGEFCSIHNPSNHPLNTAPLNWRADTAVMERICTHGVGHPDPDHIAYVESVDPAYSWQRIHGCDGCCHE